MPHSGVNNIIYEWIYYFLAWEQEDGWTTMKKKRSLKRNLGCTIELRLALLASVWGLRWNVAVFEIYVLAFQV